MACGCGVGLRPVVVGARVRAAKNPIGAHPRERCALVIVQCVAVKAARVQAGVVCAVAICGGTVIARQGIRAACGCVRDARVGGLCGKG